MFSPCENGFSFCWPSMGTNNSPVASGYLYLFCGHKPLWLVLLSEDLKLGQRKHTLSFCQEKKLKYHDKFIWSLSRHSFPQIRARGSGPSLSKAVLTWGSSAFLGFLPSLRSQEGCQLGCSWNQLHNFLLQKGHQTFRLGTWVPGSMLYVFRASDPKKLLISIPLLGTVNELVDPATREKCETPCPNYCDSRWGCVWQHMLQSHQETGAGKALNLVPA